MDLWDSTIPFIGVNVVTGSSRVPPGSGTNSLGEDPVNDVPPKVRIIKASLSP